MSWTISEWPWSGSLGERWSARPPVTPPGQKWPGVRWFGSEAEALEFVREWPAAPSEDQTQRAVSRTSPS